VVTRSNSIRAGQVETRSLRRGGLVFSRRHRRKLHVPDVAEVRFPADTAVTVVAPLAE